MIHVILAPHGTARRIVDADEIKIPDLWHIAMSFPDKSKEQEAILTTWHLCHDLLDNIKGNTEVKRNYERSNTNG